MDLKQQIGIWTEQLL